MTRSVWSIEVTLTEDPQSTHAEAVLAVGDRTFHGYGLARRNPVDPDVPRIGEEFATARALSDLSHRLSHAAAGAIEALESQSAKVSG